MTGRDWADLADLDWWGREYDGVRWESVLTGADAEEEALLTRCTYAGRPFGDEQFVEALSERFGRHWVRGRPTKRRAEAAVGGCPVFCVNGAPVVSLSLRRCLDSILP